MIFTLCEAGEVHFCLFGTSDFYEKAENEKLSLRACVVVRISRRPLADYRNVRDCTKKRAARAARLLFLIQLTNQIIDLWRCRGRCQPHFLNSLKTTSLQSVKI